ncbi:uncharacterized protein LOC131157953 [Malania oleifera]|uniref:uncharacterized protein LOC131157953 n=1 Tax=Malania oleifera TaxID=397392 RepID=UPI0025AE291B|nr:uncharacterized protein LOC131157953 [Malania oleifera]XP_057968416.1 uncharacterized protein LOC131157953 [Malania oleifera]
MDQRGTILREFRFPREPSMQHRGGSVFEQNAPENSLGLLLNQNPPSVESTNLLHQIGKYQFHSQHEFPASRQTSNVNFLKPGVEKISKPPIYVPSESFHDEGLPLIKTTIGETLVVSNGYNMLSQTESSKPISLLRPFNFQTESLRPLRPFPQSVVKPDALAVDMDGKVCSQKGSKIGISCDLDQSGHTTAVIDSSHVGSVSVEVSSCTEQGNTDRFLQNEAFSSSAPLNISSSDNFKVRNKLKVIQEMEGSDIKSSANSFKEAALTKNGDSPADISGHGERSEQSGEFLKLDEKGKSNAGRVASTVAEKLWDGSLQLNSTITASAVAFFKSGERIPDVKWCEFVEVKGKVRLEAFEKYIQDLPRSRTRGLMVVSLCWKDGSSETGRVGMKQVAKKYKEGEKVGFAQLSSGIDLYICPRSDTIITILAKHGFFKGMAAIEDNQDSLIGCVVWRKNRSSNSVAKKPERKIFLSEPLNAASGSFEEKSLSNAQPAEESNQLASLTGCKTLDSAGKCSIESSNIECSKVQIEGDTSSSVAIAFPAPRNSPSTLVGDQSVPPSNLAVIPDPIGQLKVEAPPKHRSGQVVPKTSLELQESGMSLQSDIIRPPTVPAIDDDDDDDDDLPEYDFRTAHRVSQTSAGNPLDAVTLDKRLPVEVQKIDGSVPAILPIVKAVPAPNQRSKNLTHPRPQIDANEGMPPLKKARELESQLPGFSKLEGRATVTSVSSTSVSRPKNLFDDDDDMPEWCFPDIDLHKQLLTATTNLSTASIPSKGLNSVNPVFPQPLYPSSSPVTMRMPFSPRAFPQASSSPIAISVKPAQPRAPNGYVHRGLTPPVGFISNPVLRPPHKPSDINLPIHPTGWRSQKP